MNCVQYERLYSSNVISESRDHSEIVFREFLRNYEDKVCPKKGNVTYADDKVMCDIHVKEEEAEGEVPIL